MRSMSDPAVEAAQRYAATLEYGANGRLRGYDLTAAAREALKPLQEKHRRVDVSATSCPEECETHEDECPLDVKVPVCRECFRVAEGAYAYFAERPGWADAVGWPCATAKLIYREDEL